MINLGVYKRNTTKLLFSNIKQIKGGDNNGAIKNSRQR